MTDPPDVHELLRPLYEWIEDQEGVTPYAGDLAWQRAYSAITAEAKAITRGRREHVRAVYEAAGGHKRHGSLTEAAELLGLSPQRVNNIKRALPSEPGDVTDT